MNVHIDGHVVELQSEGDVALFITCLLPTPGQVDAAKARTEADRREAEQQMGVTLDANGHMTVIAP